MSTSTLERRSGDIRSGDIRPAGIRPAGIRSGHVRSGDSRPVRQAPGRSADRPVSRPVNRAMTARADLRRPITDVAAPTRRSASRCAQPVSAQRIRARRAGAVAILVGVALALTVWIVGVLGNSYADSVTPRPVATGVVHVRQGDSLSTIASRVAPDMPTETVIDKIVELNDLQSSGLRVGQPLLTPEYR